MTRIPTSTYRLQIHSGFTLDDACDQLDYLSALGVGAVYLSPILTSTTGSAHGYDTTDPTRVDPARGGEEAWTRFADAARAAGLGVVLDIVPNHLGIAVPAENPAWWDVLRHGRDSAYANWFDIDWARGPILLPVLGDDADLAKLTLSRDADQLLYFEHRFPVAPGTAAPGDDPGAVHARQHYRLIGFRRGDSEVSYRRFFTVTSLAGVRVDDPAVFAATHERVLRMVCEGQLTGLRVDHPDGLSDPGTYLDRLRAAAGELWLVIEKILEPGERLQPWPIEGTTGYDALTQVAHVFYDPAAEARLAALYRDLTADERDYAAHVAAGKTLAAGKLLAAEVARIAKLIPASAAATPSAPEPVEGLDSARLRDALVELAVAVAVYRSYVPEAAEYLDSALAQVGASRPDLTDVLDAVGPVLHDPAHEAARRFEQLCGATMAKGVEDTAYYRYARFVAANEVGGEPAHIGLSLDAFHAAMADRQASLPNSMTSLATHDTKRGEDVRARLAVLTELDEPWVAFAKAFVERSGVPSRPLAYLLAQVMAGTGPIEPQRLRDYALKAAKEAKDGTDWVDGDPAFEAAVAAGVDAAYADPGIRRPWDDLVETIADAGRSNSLSQKLVQLTMPGVPDVYQGTELWDDSLVDPDNRRPVDYAARRALLDPDAPPAVDSSGAAKLWLVARTLRLRRAHPEWFTGYRPLWAQGPAAEHVLAYDRGGAITIATRLPLSLAARGGWGDTHLTLDGAWTDLFTGVAHKGEPTLDQLLAKFPAALLVRADQDLD